MFGELFIFRKKIKKYLPLLLFLFSFTTLPILSSVRYNFSSQFNLKEYAKTVTIGIETPGSSGSGVIIGRKNNRYLFITAKHVANIKPSQNNEYWVYSLINSQNKYKVDKIFYPKVFSGHDLALGTFETSDNLPIAVIFKPNFKKHKIFCYLQQTYYQKSNDERFIRNCDDDWEIVNIPLVSGISIPTKSIPVPLLRSSNINIIGRVKGNQNGYEVIYTTSSTVPGMSGGGVFGTRTCNFGTKPGEENFAGYYGGLLAIHGMSEEYLESGGRSGTSLGIPLDLFSDYFKSISKDFGIPYYYFAPSLCR